MKKTLRDTIAFGLCSFDAGIERDLDGYGYLVGREPTEPCPKVCDYCQRQADYIAKLIEDGKYVDKQSD